MKKTLLLALALLAATPLYAQYSSWGAFVNLEGKMSSTGEAVAKPEAFIPIYEGNNNLVFIDLRGYLRNPLQGGISLGFGYRQMVGDKIILGANAFYDGEATENGNYFNQAGLGLELLSEKVELRFNFYLPQGNEQEILDTQILYGQINDGNFEIVYKQGDMESAMMGGDAFFTFNQELPAEFFLTATIGGYMYFGGEFHQDVYGFAASLGIEKDLDIFGGNATLWANGGYGWNNRDGHHGFGSLGLKIGLDGNRAKKGVERQMYSSVERENDIKTNVRVSEEAAQTYDATTTIDGKTYSELTELTAADDVEGVIEALGDNTLVLLRGEDGVIHVSSAVDLNEGQTIIGEGRVFEIVGPQGQKCYVIVDSERAEIAGTANDEAVFNLADHVTLANMDISGAGPVVVYGEDIDDTNIVGISFDLKNGQTGIMINGGSNIQIEDIAVNAASDSQSTTAMEVQFTNGVSIKNVELSGVTTGLALFNNSNVYISDANIILSTDQTFFATGIILGENADATLDNINVYGNAGASIGIFATANGNVEINNSWFGNLGIGVVALGNDNINVSNTTVTDSATGMEMFDNDNVNLNNVNASKNQVGLIIAGSDKVTLYDIITNENDVGGIQIIGANNVFIDGLTSNSNGGNGVIISGVENLTLNNALANENGGMGIYLYQVTNISGNQIEVSGNLGDGLYVGESSSVSIDGLIANNNAGSGAYFYDVTSTFIDNVLSTNNLDNGIAISDSMLAIIRNAIVTGNDIGVFVSNNSSLVDIDGVAADQNLTAGMIIENVSDLEIDQSTAENNWGDGIAIYFADSVVMNGVVANYNGMTGIYFYKVTLAQTEDVTVIGNGTDFVDIP